MERLAAKAGIQLRYAEAGPGAGRAQQGQRQRLVAAHAAAAEFYAGQLGTAGARPPASSWPSAASTRPPPRRTAAASPPTPGTRSPSTCGRRASRAEELITAGLAKPARSGSLIDRFRRRLLWPIRDLAGDVIGFGARKLFDDDDGPKYLNTPETPLYKKSHVLYGIDLAKREIAKQGRAVIVEGYTDVMACHLAGVPTAVATCGTAFGADHIGVLRRLLMDTDAYAGEIIFTFDGDAAGQKAALRAFEDDQRFVGPDLHRGEPGQHGPVRAAAGQGRRRGAGPGRPAGAAGRLRAALAPGPLRPGHRRGPGRRIAGDRAARRQDQGPGAAARSTPASSPACSAWRSKSVHRAVVARRWSGRRAEPATAARWRADRRQIHAPWWSARRSSSPSQEPALAGPMFDAVDETVYAHPMHASIRVAIAAAGGAAGGRRRRGLDRGGPRRVRRPRWQGAGVASLRSSRCGCDGVPDPHYVQYRCRSFSCSRSTGASRDAKSRLQRVNPVEKPDEYHRLFGELLSLEQHARALREQTCRSMDLSEVIQESDRVRSSCASRRPSCAPRWSATSGCWPGLRRPMTRPWPWS